jgi:hypothetical protein
MEVDQSITALTARHVGKCLSQLEDAGTPRVCLDAVKREFWYLHNDIQQVVSEKKEKQDDRAN